MATILAGMPELRRRFLTEHAPDPHGHCLACGNGAGSAAGRPCLPFRIAREAQRIADSAVLAPRIPARAWQPVPPTDGVAEPRRLTAVPAASWRPHW